ncbi:MAG: esterase family protein [Muribaculaceae bacterium]|nr:esterase family protein [Muribaculaceae bacterium]
MKCKLILAMSAVFMGVTAFAQGSKVINAEMPSKILGENKTYTIYLPEGYDNDDTRYPVLYLLHGAWGNDRDWTEKGTMQEITDLTVRSGTALPMIVVMPDASGIDENYGGERMGYFNVPGWNYEDYFFNELIPYIDATYRTKADKTGRAIAGLSMGGGGTVAYAQKHPEYFSSACSLSGLVGLCDQRPDDNGSDFYKSLALNDQAKYVDNADPDTTDALKTVRWYADCGDDDFLADANLAFYTSMRRKGIPIEYRMRDGAHNWTYWRTALPDVLRFCSISFK